MQFATRVTKWNINIYICCQARLILSLHRHSVLRIHIFAFSATRRRVFFFSPRRKKSSGVNIFLVSHMGNTSYVWRRYMWHFLAVMSRTRIGLELRHVTRGLIKVAPMKAVCLSWKWSALVNAEWQEQRAMDNGRCTTKDGYEYIMSDEVQSHQG